MSIDEIAIRLKNARKTAKMTQAEAAAHLGITYQAISNYERGITRVDTDTLVKLCAVYNISVSDILGSDSYAISDPASPSAIDVVDPELQEYLEVLRTRPEMRMLFSTTKTATKAQIEAIVNFIEGLQGK